MVPNKTLIVESPAEELIAVESTANLEKAVVQPEIHGDAANDKVAENHTIPLQHDVDANLKNDTIIVPNPEENSPIISTNETFAIEVSPETAHTKAIQEQESSLDVKYDSNSVSSQLAKAIQGTNMLEGTGV